jgi:crooked neck
MTWEPNEHSWTAYIKFEERMNEIDNARAILERYIEVRPCVSSYLKAAKFEEKSKHIENARVYYERCVAELSEEALEENFFLAFTKFEARNKEIDRARVLFKYALDNIPKEKAGKLYSAFVAFEKQHGSKEEMELVILTKRRHIYESILSDEPFNYDIWFDYSRLEENDAKDLPRAREIYERAISQVPPAPEKKFWRRYIYLWINYAVFEELIANEPERANEIYEKALALVPHQEFTFSKLWVLYSHFLIRCKELEKARKIFGMAIGKCPRVKIFKAYAELELQLGNIERVRYIYERFIEIFPENSNAWAKYA